MPINSFLYPGAKVVPPYEVANSCRFNDDDSAYMQKTPSSASGRRTFTFSFWIKRGNISSVQTPFSAGNSSTEQIMRFEAGDTFYILDYQSSATKIEIRTSRVFRDPSSWYNIIIAVDTTQGTASNRVKIYVNGVQETSFGTATYPDQNTDLMWNSDVLHAIGRKESGDNEYFDGYLAEVVNIDGSQLEPTSFGEFDSDSPNIWKPKDVSGLTFGTNGFYLDFEDSSNLGNDANGGTDFTEANLAATDQSTDTCTNNFATISPIASQTRIQTLSEGNLKATYNSGSNGGTNWATIAATSGKWYAECFVNTMGYNGTNIGVLNVDSTAFPNSSSTALGQDNFSAGYYKTGILYRNVETNHTGNTNDDFDSYDANDIISIAMDLDNGFFYWAKNGTWQNSGDPTSAGTGTGGVATSYLTANETYTFTAWIRNGSVISWNFGSPPSTFSISSGNADANGFGNFEYSVPSGYFSLCTKNLAEFG